MNLIRINSIWFLSSSFLMLQAGNPLGHVLKNQIFFAPGGIQFKEGSNIEFDDNFESRGKKGEDELGNSSSERKRQCESRCQSDYIADLKNCKFAPNEGECAFAAVMKRSSCVDKCGGK